MADLPSPPLVGLDGRSVLNPWSPQTQLGQALIHSRVNGATAVYTAANQACFVPWEVERPTLVTRLWVLNGTSVSGNIDLGIYRGTTRLASSGSVAQAGVSTIQQVDIADTWIYPDEEITFAISMDNIVGHVFRHTLSNAFGRLAGYRIQSAGAWPLPATSAPIETSVAYYPVIGGVARRSLAL